VTGGGPLVLQSDHTLMVEASHPQYAECRDFLGGFAELVKAPEFIPTYRLTPLSLWNAAALEIPLDEILGGLSRYGRYEPPPSVLADLCEWYAAYGELVLEKAGPDSLILTVRSLPILERLRQDRELRRFWTGELPDGFRVRVSDRGEVKHALIKVGYPVKDLCGYTPGDPLDLCLRNVDLAGRPFDLRDYQTDAVEAFYHSGRATGGSGVIVLPCGSGKTIIGLGVLRQVAASALVITTNNVSVHQWRDELLARTTVDPHAVGEYTGQVKNVKPVTITTYQMLTYRRSKDEPMENLELFQERNWGLIIYDEVHLLPAPVFRATSGIQAKRRLGLTATLVREDGNEDDVFALIGPKRYDVPWKTLENRGYIAEAYCTEYRLPLPPGEERAYAYADKRNRFRLASENSRKVPLAEELMANHADDHILIIGQYLSQLEKISAHLKLPLITGKTRHEEREKLYGDFKAGRLRALVVSKVANFAVDLPDANVMIEISGMFGSRQEEAQRLGRILRPKHRPSHFYTLVSRGTDEQRFAVNRQIFLVEQGYKYQIRYEEP